MERSAETSISRRPSAGRRHLGTTTRSRTYQGAKEEEGVVVVIQIAAEGEVVKVPEDVTVAVV
jgi:hypothetical protein